MVSVAVLRRTFLTFFVGRAVQTWHLISGGAEVNDHFATMMVDMVKKKSTRHKSSWHGAKNHFFT